MNPLIGGLLAALGISVISFAVAQAAGKRLRWLWKTAIAESMAGTAVRIALTVLGIVGVFVMFGRSWGIPCALGTIPLYLIELTLSAALLIRRLKAENAEQSSEPNQ